MKFEEDESILSSNLSMGKAAPNQQRRLLATDQLDGP
jgi:hypothetical protein